MNILTMNPKQLCSALALSAALALASPARATVITTATGVDDTATGLSWLKLNATLVQATPTAVPEPASLALFSIGLFALAALRRGRSDPAHNCST